MKFVHYSYKDKTLQKSTLEGGSFTLVYVMDDICLTGTQGNQPATKTRQDSLFTSKHSEIATISETCVEPIQSGIVYAGKILSSGLYFNLHFG